MARADELATVLGVNAANQVDKDYVGKLATIRAPSGTTDTLLLADCGNIVRPTSGSAVTETLPATFPAGWNVAVIQGGAGQITLSPASGATMHNADSNTKTASQYSAVSLLVVSNSNGVSAVYDLFGSTGT